MVIKGMHIHPKLTYTIAPVMAIISHNIVALAEQYESACCIYNRKTSIPKELRITHFCTASFIRGPTVTEA